MHQKSPERVHLIKILQAFRQEYTAPHRPDHNRGEGKDSPLSMTKVVLLLSRSFRSFLGVFLLRRLRARSRPCPDTFLLTSISSKRIVIILRSFLVSARKPDSSSQLREIIFRSGRTSENHAQPARGWTVGVSVNTTGSSTVCRLILDS